MSIFAILIVSFSLVVGGNLIDKSKDSKVEREKIEVVANTSVEKKPTVQEITPEPKVPEPVKEEIALEPVKEEIIPEPVKEEIVLEPVKEEIVLEPVKEEITPEPVKEEVKKIDNSEDSGTNYFRLVLYIISGILVVLTGMYFFSKTRKSISPSTQPETTEPKTVEEEAQPETTEPKTVEDENNNK